MSNDRIQPSELLLMIISIAVLVGFFIYMQNASNEAEKLKVEKLYREQCQSDSVLLEKINELSKKVDRLEVIHAHKLK